MSTNHSNDDWAEPGGGNSDVTSEMKDQTAPLGSESPYSNFKHAPKPVGDPWETLLKPELEVDTARCSAWKDEVQNLLIFAGLFSAVVTAFLVESYKFLQPDPNDAIISLLFHVANGFNNSIPFPSSVTSSFAATTFSRNSSSVRVNVFWFISLILSLTTVLIGTISLQWLREHQSYPNFSCKEKLAILHMRLESLEVWYVPQIFAALPVLLQVALALFLAGLIDFVMPLGPRLSIPISIIIGLTLLFLVATTGLPICQGFVFLTGFYPYRKPPTPCAFKSPQSYVILVLFSPLLRILSYAAPSRVSRSMYFRLPRFRRYNANPFLRKTFRQQTWPAFDRQWLSLRDAYRQCILDKDGGLRYHLQSWQDSFPLSDITQCLVQAITEAPAAKHTETFLCAVVLCFQELSTSMWITPLKSYFFQRKDRRYNYFKSLYLPVEQCSLSEILLHGGTYDYNRYTHFAGPNIDQYLDSPATRDLFCQDQVLIFINFLLHKHTSPTLSQYQLELWSHILSSNHQALVPQPDDSTGIRTKAFALMLAPTFIQRGSPYDQQPTILMKVISVAFKLAASCHISPDPTMISLWTRTQTSGMFFRLGSTLVNSLHSNFSSEQNVAQYRATFRSITNHINKEISNTSSLNTDGLQEDSSGIFFRHTSIFVWSMFQSWPLANKRLSSNPASRLEKVVGSVEFRSLLQALQEYRTRSNGITLRSQVHDYSYYTYNHNQKGVVRFSDEWWDVLFRNASKYGIDLETVANGPASPDKSAPGLEAPPGLLLQEASTMETAVRPSSSPASASAGIVCDTAAPDFADKSACSSPFISNGRDDDMKKQEGNFDLPGHTNGGTIDDDIASNPKNSPLSHSRSSSFENLKSDPLNTQDRPPGLLGIVDAVSESRQSETSYSVTEQAQSGGPHSAIDFGSPIIAAQIELEDRADLEGGLQQGKLEPKQEVVNIE